MSCCALAIVVPLVVVFQAIVHGSCGTQNCAPGYATTATEAAGGGGGFVLWCLPLQDCPAGSAWRNNNTAGGGACAAVEACATASDGVGDGVVAFVEDGGCAGGDLFYCGPSPRAGEEGGCHIAGPATEEGLPTCPFDPHACVAVRPASPRVSTLRCTLLRCSSLHIAAHR